MKILVANDDGIRSPGLEHLVRMARNLGEVWVVAPSGQCSAMSQRISVFGTRICSRCRITRWKGSGPGR